MGGRSVVLRTISLPPPLTFGLECRRVVFGHLVSLMPLLMSDWLAPQHSLDSLYVLCMQIVLVTELVANRPHTRTKTSAGDCPGSQAGPAALTRRNLLGNLQGSSGAHRSSLTNRQKHMFLEIVMA